MLVMMIIMTPMTMMKSYKTAFFNIHFNILNEEATTIKKLMRTSHCTLYYSFFCKPNTKTYIYYVFTWDIRTYRISVGRFIIVFDFEKCELNAKKKTRYEKMWNSFEKKEKKNKKKKIYPHICISMGKKQSKAKRKVK